MTLRRIFHVNVNCTDFDRSLAFYLLLGFEPAHRPREQVSDEHVEVALQLPAGAVARGALLKAGEGPDATFLDLLEWRVPATEGAPYPSLTHAGAARIALLVDDLDAALAPLRDAGVELLSEPVTSPLMGGVRFVCLKDPDGTVLELLEFAGGRPPGSAP